MIKEERDFSTKNKQKYQLFIEVYGVRIGIWTNRKKLFEEIKLQINKTFPIEFKTDETGKPEHKFYLKALSDGLYELHKDKDKELQRQLNKRDIFLDLDRNLRLTVAEFAVSKVFLHAGVVCWNGKAIILPADSFSGKTTLVAELIKKGALYYSDEYAVLDESGFVHPYPKMLSLRGIIDDYRQLDCSYESLGAEAGTEPVPVGLVLITKYKSGKKLPKKFKPKILSGGQGVLEIIQHSMSIRTDPEFALKTLNKIANNAIIAKNKRGEANGFAELLLNFLQNN